MGCGGEFGFELVTHVGQFREITFKSEWHSEAGSVDTELGFSDVEVLANFVAIGLVGIRQSFEGVEDRTRALVVAGVRCLLWFCPISPR